MTKLGFACSFLVLTLASTLVDCSSVPTRSPAAASSGDLQLAEWIRQSAAPVDADLSVFDTLASQAQVFGFGESNHGLRDHPEFRNRLFKYLVEKHGYRLLMIESGILEGRLVERYIQGDPEVTLRDALTNGITHGMGPWVEMRDLVEWCREYNARQTDPAKKIHFAGPDLPVVGDAPAMALEQIEPKLDENSELMRLARKASAVTDQFAEILQKHGKQIDPDWLDGLGSISFDQLTEEEQRKLEQGIDALVARKTRKSDVWNTQLAVIAQQMVRNLRSRQAHPHIPFWDTGIKYLKVAGLYDSLKVVKDYSCDTSDPAQVRDYFLGRESRERALADNVIWAHSLHGGKTFLFAHNNHLMKAEMDVMLGDVHIGKTSAKGEGEFIADHYGSDYVMIMGTMDRYVDENGKELTEIHGQPYIPTASCTDCMEKTMTGLPLASPLFLDFTRTVGEIRALLDQDRQVRDQLVFQRINTLRAYDGMVFIKDMREAVRLRR